MLLPIALACLSSTQVIQQPKWIAYRDEHSVLSVEFPGPTWPRIYLGVFSNSPLTGAYRRIENRSFVFVYCDLPKDADPETFLPQVYDQHIAKVRWAQIVSRDFVVWKGCPTYEGTFTVGGEPHDLSARVRLMVVGKRLYQQYALWKPGIQREIADVDRFFDSLKFL